MSKSRSQLIDYLRCIDITGKTVLDVGAGSKEHWARNWVKGKPKEYITCDTEKFDNIDFILDLNFHPAKSDIKGKFIKKYDVVFCLETLEHVWNPLRAIETLIMHTGEVLYISTPFIQVEHDVHDYLRYTHQFFGKVLPMYGFDEVEIYPRTVTYKDEFINFITKEGIRMSKITYQMGLGDHLFDLGYFIKATRKKHE